MNKTYKDVIPANANILIEYGKNDKVSFSYPIEWTYTKAVLSRAFPTIFLFFIILYIKLFLWILYCSIPILLYWVYIDSNFILKGLIFINNHSEIFINICCCLIFFALFFPFLLALKKEWLTSLMPKFGYYTAYLMGMMKEKTFIFVDVTNKQCIIPNFSNVFLEYNAIGDFNKYLTKITIQSYLFDFKLIHRFGLFLKYPKQKNDYIYYAIFEFEKQPYEGYLECTFC